MLGDSGLQKHDFLVLFGADKGWHPGDWTDSDDRVRGGKSHSYLECTKDVGRFYGTLDIKTLGGAGFASQRTAGEDHIWDLSAYVGVLLTIAKGDKKRYTFTIKDTLLPLKDGREQSTISWEIDFELPPQTIPGDTQHKTVFVPWDALNATYRGRVKKDADPLDLAKIKRFSIMMRSFFGTQEGDFSLSIESIKALKKVPKEGSCLVPATPTDAEVRQMEEGHKEKRGASPSPPMRSVRQWYHTAKAVVVGVLVVCLAGYHVGRWMDIL